MVWGAMLIGVIGIIWFVARQFATPYQQGSGMLRRLVARSPKVEVPLLDLHVLRNRSFMVGTIVAAMTFFAFSSIMVIIPLYIQNDRGYSAVMSGLIMLPGAIGQCIAQFGGGRALDRFGARPVALTGTIILLLGTFGMGLIGPHTWIWWVSICQFTRQIGMGFLLMLVTTWSLNCLEPSEVSAGSAVTNTVRQIAGAMGAPILVIIMESVASMRANALGGGHAAEIAGSIFGVQTTLHISTVIVAVMLAIVFFGVRGEGAGSSRELARKAVAKLHR